MKKLLFISVFILNLIQNFVYSQQTKIDSLLTVIRTSKEDTTIVNTLNNLFTEYEFTDDQKALDCLNKALDLSKKIDFKTGLADTYTYLGYFSDDKGDYSEAIKNYTAALKIRSELGDKNGISAMYNNIGLVFSSLGNYPEALKNYFLCLKIKELIGEKKGIAASYNNIGIVYKEQGNYQGALKNFFISLKIKMEIGDKKGVAFCYNNIGLVYERQGKYADALANYNTSLKVLEEIGNKSSVATCYNNIGDVYGNKGNYPEALKNYFISLGIREAIGDKNGISMTSNNIGIIYYLQKKYKKAEVYFIKAKDVSKEIGSKTNLRDSYVALAKLDSANGDYKGAYENHKRYILYRDSLDNEETRKKTIQSQMTYDFEKKEAATKSEQDKKDAISSAEKKRQTLFLLFLAALAIAITIIAIVIFRGLQQSKKAKKVIEIQRDEISLQKETVEHQKVLVEEKQKEIVDSITYAKRIQYTLLANKQLLDANLPKHFVLFKPKDIVSGDFYWATRKCNRFYIAACDSTGHGVPGAFMSLLNISFLNEAVNEKNIIEPNEILNHVRNRLIANMDGGQDGMDCILLCIETNNNAGSSEFENSQQLTTICTYAAANNSPSIIKNGKLISLDADKMPVGKGETGTSFTLRTIDLEKGDSLYLYTDGYADQFGGPKGKKFKYKQLDELLVSISNKPLTEQSEILDYCFENWKGNLEQVDDMLVIGIKN